MTQATNTELSSKELDAIAWNFLKSGFAGHMGMGQPIAQRMDAFLVHSGLIRIVYDASLYDTLLQRITANVGSALRSGMPASRKPRRNSEPAITRSTRQPARFGGRL